MKKNQQGFTLIELLVVVAIIGLLATLSIVALNNARARARDARRVADVKQIQTALELYYNDYGIYPATVPTSGTVISSGTTVYMSQVPTPPQPADGSCAAATVYTYTVQDSNRSYSLTYCLGTATGGITSGIGTATPAGIKL
ncbi:MAG: prepilin-type N-terminal cleavage/methylation domain-containing protein [Patescibacteria group bacterium]